MVSQQSLIYSPLAAARILGVATSAIVGFKLWAHVAWISVRGQRPIFVSLRAFKAHFVSKRRADSENLIVVSNPMMGGYVVENPAKGSQYCCVTYSDRVVCECEDYKNQLQFYGRGVCKHGYAVLHELGFGDLRSYLAVAGEKV